MVTVLDLAYALLIAAAFPLLDYFVFLPGFRRRATIDAESAKSWFWNVTLGELWLITAIGVAVWIGNARSCLQLGFNVPSGWRAWSAIGICGLFIWQSSVTIRKVSRSEKARASVRKQFGSLGVAGSLMPSTNSGLAWWVVISLSAGLCEEFLFRGYLIWVLSPFLGWWGAAAISVVLFAIAHAYQGSKGILTTGIMGVALTATVAIFQSLLPAIALHALMDLSSGYIAWLGFCEQGKPMEQAAIDTLMSKGGQSRVRPLTVVVDSVAGAIRAADGWPSRGSPQVARGSGMKTIAIGLSANQSSFHSLHQWGLAGTDGHLPR